MPARTPAPFDLESLKTALPKIFDQAQNTAANHQKNFIALYKLQSEAAAIQSSVQNGKSTKLTGEKAFQDAYDDVLLRVLPNKKGATVADRAVKFMTGYAKFITERVAEEREKELLDADEETSTERFLSHTVHFLLQGCTAKDKVVRYRVLQCLAETIPHLSDIDEDLYASLRKALIDRLRDKEAAVRAQAAAALAKLSFSEDTSELDEDETPLIEIVIEAMTYDTSAEVRRAALQALPLSPPVLPSILERTRDVDPAIRKAVYTNVLEKYCTVSENTVGFTHPRILSIAQREDVVRNGLGDRESSVKTAAGQLLATWVDIVRSNGTKKEEEEVKKEAVEELIEDLVAFLNLFDLTEGTVAEDALGSVFDTRKEFFEHLEIPESYWNDITPQRAFLARVFIDKCKERNYPKAQMEAYLPLTTAMAFRISDAYNALVQQQEADDAAAMLGEEDEEAHAAREEARIEHEITLGELLRTAVSCDFGDEIGRRKMFQTVHGMLVGHALPESLLPRALEVLRELSPSEQDLIRVVVEIVHELRDPPEEEGDSKLEPDESMTEFGSPRRPRLAPPPKSPADMTPEERQRADAVDLRCLSVCIAMLERVNGTFEENMMLEGILTELIVPAVKRREMQLREKGLISLGLCCLIARRMALGSFQLFLGQVATSPEVLKLRVIQIIFDILMVHEGAFLGQGSTNGDKIVDFLLQLLENEELPRVQALLCVGLAKLMLAGMIAEERVLQTLVLVFISPETAENQELRQCLSYFFPVYAYSSVANQRRMRNVFIPTFEKIAEAYRDWDGEEILVTPTQVSHMFADWTDPVRAETAVKGIRNGSDKDPVQLELAADIVKALFSVDYDKEDKKALCQMLGKLHMPDEVDDDKVRTLKLLVSNLRSRRPPRDTTAKNALAKFETALSKKYERQLENFSEEELRKLEELRDMFEFLDDIIPLEEDEDEPPRKGRKRRSMSVATATTTSAATSGDRTPPPSPKSRSKRRRLSTSDDESSDDDDTSRRSPSATPVATRAMPRRNAAEKSKQATHAAFKKPIQISSDEDDDDDEGGGDDDDDDEEERAPTPKPKARGSRKPPPPKAKSSRARQEVEIDEDIDEMLESNATKDSIMDSSSDEDDDDEEVDNIL